MGATFVVTLREAFEAALILGIVYGYLEKIKARRGYRYVTWGGVLGVVASVGVGIAVTYLSGPLLDVGPDIITAVVIGGAEDIGDGAGFDLVLQPWRRPIDVGARINDVGLEHLAAVREGWNDLPHPVICVPDKPWHAPASPPHPGAPSERRHSLSRCPPSQPSYLPKRKRRVKTRR